jgi:ubiquinone/menaquinone biosynthesis C-methylase UbiE
MGFWREQVVPRLANKTLDTVPVRDIRERVCAGLQGDVIELGFGSGLNVPHYPSAVAGVWAVDPSGVALRLAASRIAASRVPVHAAGLDGAELDLPDRRFDSALSTFTLCTVPDVERALTEVLRVLVPGGTFHFVEHGRSPDRTVARWQGRIEPVQRRLAGGCHLTRDIDELIGQAGFDVDALDNYYAPLGPKPFTYFYEGRARKSAEAA